MKSIVFEMRPYSCCRINAHDAQSLLCQLYPLISSTNKLNISTYKALLKPYQAGAYSIQNVIYEYV